MEFTFHELFTAFLYSLITGYILGLIYEPVRFFHLAFSKSACAYFITDTLFMVFCALVTFFFSLSMLEGRVRGFVIIGEIAGFSAYRFSLRYVFDLIYKPIIKIFKKIFKKLLKIGSVVMYNLKIKLSELKSLFKDKVRLYEERRNEKRKCRRGKEKRLKRSNSSKEKTK